MKSKNVTISLVILLFLCGCLILTLSFGNLVVQTIKNLIDDPAGFPLFSSDSPTPTVTVERPLLESSIRNTENILHNTLVPINDLPDLACRLQDLCNVPSNVAPPAAALQIGERGTFWVSDMDTNENFQVHATLQYITEHSYFWIQENVHVNAADLRDLAEAFENHIYPTTRVYFGSEWIPGVDGDPHIYILYARGLGFLIAGYFSSADEYHPLAHPYSNAHEMFFLNADTIVFSENFTYGVLAHEFQHMIHWYQDRNESSWLNEGLSELSALLNGYDWGGFDLLYTSKPDLQLNDWPSDELSSSSNYGASFLFTTYFFDRFGEEATRALVGNPQNGLASIDSTLAKLNITDAASGHVITADDFFMDWVITNYLNANSVADGRYAYYIYPSAPRARTTEIISTCPYGPANRSVHQYGVDYILFNCSGEYTLHFEGSTLTRLLPTDPYSGFYAFWSNKGDESDMTLTRQFDFSDADGPITLTYWTWYDLEEDCDYLYLEASSDGQRWQILATPSGTADDPSGNSYGWAYNGMTDGWIREEVDLSQFAGQQIYLRFEYITDAAVYGEGFLLDDIAIPEIGYFSDFENNDGGWQAEGFARVQNLLPQVFRLALITRGSNDVSVQMIPLSADQTVDIVLRLENGTTEAVLVVSGITRFTRELANYTFEIRREPR